MRSLVILVLIGASAVLAESDVIDSIAFADSQFYHNCTTSANNTVPISSTVHVGCNSYANDVNVTWTLQPTTASNGLMLDFLSFFTESTYDVLNVTCLPGSSNPILFGPYSGSRALGDIWCAGPVQMSFRSDASNIDPGFSIEVTTVSNPEVIVSGHVVGVTKQIPGGFVYFELPQQQLGKNVTFDLVVSSYAGLQSPTLFVQNVVPPLLESTGATRRDTDPSQCSSITNLSMADAACAQITINRPLDGNWFAGVFLYGSAATFSLSATWNFNINWVTSGQKITASLSGGNDIDYYQIFVPRGQAGLNVQISRKVPGDYPILYMSQGSLPGPDSFGLKLDTHQASYINHTLPNPNPAGNSDPNPGDFIVAVQSAASSGYILDLTLV